MRRNDKFHKGKEIRRIYAEWRKMWTSRWQHGEWITVTPYQQGWVRYFDLRKDIKNRSDAPWIRKALNLVNNTIQCRTKKFERYSFSENKMMPISQDLGRLSEKEYAKVTDARVKKYLVKKLFYKNTYFAKNVPYHAYTLKHEYWAVFVIEPNMVVERWIPDPEWESRKGELDNKIETHNLWPKINRELGGYNHSKEWKLTPYLRNKRGEFIEFEEDLEE